MDVFEFLKCLVIIIEFLITLCVVVCHLMSEVHSKKSDVIIWTLNKAFVCLFKPKTIIDYKNLTLYVWHHPCLGNHMIV